MADERVLDCLNKIYLAETSGMNRYLHYSFMVMGHNRIPIQGWLRSQATEAMNHAVTIGEKITSLGGHPPISGSQIEETHVHTVDQILQESLTFEEEGVKTYVELVRLAEACGDMALEEMAREFVRLETEHVEEVRKMLRSPK